MPRTHLYPPLRFTRIRNPRTQSTRFPSSSATDWSRYLNHMWVCEYELRAGRRLIDGKTVYTTQHSELLYFVSVFMFNIILS
jgi:hypothetical protein